jgi:polyphosphate kinase 2 (PPK2 family)
MKHFAQELIVAPGSKIKLAKFDPADTLGVDKTAAAGQLTTNLERLSALQYMLYAEGRRSLLVVLQGIDAGGKDGTIKHVMSGRGRDVVQGPGGRGKAPRLSLARPQRGARMGQDRHFQPLPL